MTAALDPSIKALFAGSYQYWFNRETISAESMGPDKSTFYTVPNAKRFTVNTDDVPIQHQGIFLKDGLTWILPAATLPSGFSPKPMDKLIPTVGEEYTIQSVSKNQYKSWFKCITLNLRLALGFADTLTFQRANWTNVGGVKKPTAWTTIGAAYPGKVIETSRTYENDLNGKRQNRKKYDIHVQSLVEWRPDDRVTDQDGNIYTLTESGVPGTIDNYLIYSAEAIA